MSFSEVTKLLKPSAVVWRLPGRTAFTPEVRPGWEAHVVAAGRSRLPSWLGFLWQDLSSQECPTFWVITPMLVAVGHVSGAASVSPWLGTACCFADLPCRLGFAGAHTERRLHWGSRMGWGGLSSDRPCQCLFSRLSLSRLGLGGTPLTSTHQ